MDPEFGNVRQYRFAGFELDVANSTLRNGSGGTVRLQQQPFRLLALLASRHGELVEREEIRKHLWNDETFVDFEHSVNFCIRQIRAALGDDAKAPRFIETVPRKGYRFIAALESGEPAAPVSIVTMPPASRRLTIRPAFAAGIALIGVALFFIWYRADRTTADAGFGTDAPLAREAYIKGRYLWRKGTNADLAQALTNFEEAIRLDPNFAAAHAALADTWQLLGNRGARPARDAFPRARVAAERALTLSPNLAEAKMVLGTVLFRFDWNWKGAEENLRDAVRLDPKSAAARHDYAWFLISMRRSNEGIAEMRQAHELDPLSLRANVDIGWALLRAGQVDEAITHLRRILELEPEFIGAQHCLETAFIYKGMYPEALDFARRAVARSGVDLSQIPGANERDPKLVIEAIWRWQLQALEQRTGDPPAYRLASYHAMLGNRDKAFEWLNRAFEERHPSMVEVHVDTAFRAVRNDPRFEDLLRRIGL